MQTMASHHGPAIRRRPFVRLFGVVFCAGAFGGFLAACRGEPPADLTGRAVLPTAAGGGPMPSYAADPTAGARRFEAHCTPCHGASGAGDGPLAAGLSPRPPDWTAGDALQTRSPATLYVAIRRGVLGSSMKRFDHLFDEPSTWDLAFHVWRLPVGEATLHRGADLYARRCAACHGPAGIPPPSARAPTLVRPEWVALTRPELVDRLARAHPDIVPPPDDGAAGRDTAAIAEHIWTLLVVPAAPQPSAFDVRVAPAVSRSRAPTSNARPAARAGIR